MRYPQHVHNNLSISISSIGTRMMAVNSRQSTAKYGRQRLYTGYGSHSSKCQLVRYTVPVLWCHTYGSYSLRLTPLLDINVPWAPLGICLGHIPIPIS